MKKKTEQSNSLALSIPSLIEVSEKNKEILGYPVSYLARLRGLTVKDVYSRLLPILAEEKSLLEALKYCDFALRYATIVDINRFRAEVGLEFVTALDMVIDFVKEGLDSDQGYIKRKAMLLHGDLINEHAEKRRFVESQMVEDKLKFLAEAHMKQQELEKEIIDITEEA